MATIQHSHQSTGRRRRIGPISVTSDAALLFYGASMLLAALRGYAGCEVLAVSNWLLGRDDQVGCLLFWPIDHAERRRARAGMSASNY